MSAVPDDFDALIKREFISEAGEMLEAVETSFIAFERNPAGRGEIDKIFRLAHTLKGSALSCGFGRLGEFAHVVETLLVKIRDGELAPTAPVVDVLLKANDRLREFVGALADDFTAVVDTADVEAALLQAMGPRNVRPVVAAPAPASAGFGFFDDEKPAFEIFDDAPAAPKAVPVGSTLERLEALNFGIFVDLARLTREGMLTASDLSATTAKAEAALALLASLRN